MRFIVKAGGHSALNLTRILGFHPMKMLSDILPIRLYEWLYNAKQAMLWSKNNFLSPAPQSVKQRVLSKYSVESATWVETGTFLGTTTFFLARIAPNVVSIEPSKELFLRAQKRFSGKNVTLINGTSEDVLYETLAGQANAINIWLDGHYSGGVTFQGSSNCPVPQELAAVSANLHRFARISIFIDDIRCFVAREEGYPPLKSLVDWAEDHDLTWHIEHDILIMRNG